MKGKAADRPRSDSGTLLAFAVLTPVLYLNMTRHLQHVLPVTCHVLKENRCVLQFQGDCLKNVSRKSVKEAMDYLVQIADSESVRNDHEG